MQRPIAIPLSPRSCRSTVIHFNRHSQLAKRSRGSQSLLISIRIVNKLDHWLDSGSIEPRSRDSEGATAVEGNKRRRQCMLIIFIGRIQGAPGVLSEDPLLVVSSLVHRGATDHRLFRVWLPLTKCSPVHLPLSMDGCRTWKRACRRHRHSRRHSLIGRRRTCNHSEASETTI